jgi:nucleoside-diphosphate-sugar epimerase
MTRSPRKVETLRDLGAEPVVCDAFDAGALRAVVVGFQPEAVVNELTDLPDKPAAISEGNARMRREGTRNLLAAAKAAGASRFIAQSVAWQLSGDAGAAVSELERLVLAADGVVLRYGRLYGQAPTTKARSPSRRASTSTRPPAAPWSHLTQSPESSKSPIVSPKHIRAFSDRDRRWRLRRPAVEEAHRNPEAPRSSAV